MSAPNEAIEAAAQAVSRLWARSNESGTIPSDRAEAEEIVEAAYPIIRAAVLAEVEAAFSDLDMAGAPVWNQCVGIARSRVRSLTGDAP